MEKAVNRKINCIINLFTILFILLTFLGLLPAYGQTTGSISGKVTESDGITPITGINIMAYSIPNYDYYNTATDANGEYIITDVPAGDYQVRAASAEGQNYIGEYYDNAVSYMDADIVQVSSGESVTGINFSLDVGGSISGTVYESNGTTPIAGIYVLAFSSSTHEIFNTTTDENGEYAIAGLPAGNYQVRAESSQGQNFISEYYDNAVSSFYAVPVTVIVPSDTPDINFSLDIGGSISGTVYKSDGTTPVADVQVMAYTASLDGPGSDYYSYAFTDESGKFTITGLPTGDYYVQVYPYGQIYAFQYYNHASSESEAVPVAVIATVDTPDINFSLGIGGSISGTVYESDGITPIDGVGVYAMYDDPCERSMGPPTTIGFTDSLGAYSIENLPAGNVYLLARPQSIETGTFPPKYEYNREFYNNGYSCDEADPVVVTAGANRSGIIFQLEDYSDSDGDGMADQWEIYYFGSIASGIDSADSDNDGASNFMEYMNGTPPKEPYGAPSNSSDDDGGGGGGCCVFHAIRMGNPQQSGC